jgi:hypothetical protein
MKKQIIYFLLFFAFHSSVNAQKNPTKLGVIKEFTGVITGAGMYDGSTYLSLKAFKIGEVDFYFRTEMDDKYVIDCKINQDLKDDIEGSNANGKKVKIKAKSTYGRFENLSGEGPAFRKKIIWRPIEVIEL